MDRFIDRSVVVLSMSNMESTGFMSMTLLLSLDLSIRKLPLSSIIVLLSIRLMDGSIKKEKDAVM